MSFKMILCILYLVFEFVVASDKNAFISLKLTKDGSRIFVDEFGRERIFHGMNVVVKGEPWIPDTSKFSRDISFSEQDMALLKSYGIKHIRLGVMWPGIEPERGQYNHTYIDQVEYIVNKAGEYGIYTLLDMHQDVLSEYFCGEGIPYWAVKNDRHIRLFGKFPSPLANAYTQKNIEGYPTRQDCSKFDWPTYHLAEATQKAFEALYTNVDGIGDSWAQMWGLLAKRFKNNKYILGYELINEPFVGNLYHNPLLAVPIWPFSGDYQLMQEAYDKISDAIRKENEDALIFFAGETWDDFGVNFSHAPGGEQYANRSVVAYHYYEPPQFNQKFQFERQIITANTLKTGSFLTESYSLIIGHELGEMADEFLTHWTAWEYKTFCRETNQTLNSTSQRAEFGACKTGYGPEWTKDTPDYDKFISRTYAFAIAGKAEKMQFKHETSHFELKFIPDFTISEPTVIYASKNIYYPDGFIIQVNNPSSVRIEFDWEKNPNYIYVYNNNSTSTESVIITLEKK